jgi:hypothetical protein
MRQLSWVALVLVACEPCPASPVPESPEPGFYAVDVVVRDDGCAMGTSLERPFTYPTARGVPLLAGAFEGARANGAVGEDGTIRAAFELAPRRLDPEDECSASAISGSGLGWRVQVDDCSFEALQRVELTSSSPDGFRLVRHVELRQPRGSCVGPRLSIPDQGCTSHFEETWTLREAGDPAAACRARVEGAALALAALELRSPQETPVALTGSPCDASFQLVAGGLASDDVCRARLGFQHAHRLDGGGLAMGEAPFVCEPIVASSSPLRVSCTSDAGELLWATSAWAVTGLSFLVDEGGTSTVTLRFVDRDDVERSCNLGLIVE